MSSDSSPRRTEATGPDRYAAARAAFSAIAMPVVIVGAAHGSERSCATGTVMYVSLAPPEIAVALHPGSRTTMLLRAAGELSISILATDQVDAAIRAGRSAAGPDKFATAGIGVLEPAAGFAAPAVAGSIAVLWARVTDERESGDHVVVIARIEHHVALDQTRTPLLRLGRRYAAAGPPIGDAATDNYPL